MIPPCSANGPEDISPWAQVIGPCYTSAGIARVLGCTEREVADAVDSLRLLAVTTSDGVTLYPAFQVWGGRVVEGLAEVLQVLRTGTASRWTWAQWLNTVIADGDADPSSPIDELRAGRLDVVLRDAEHNAAAWRR